MTQEPTPRSVPELDAATIAEALRRLSEPPHVHRWEILGVQVPGARVAPHPRVPVSQVTVVLLRCDVCNWPETSELSGIWSEEQLRKANKENGK